MQEQIEQCFTSMLKALAAAPAARNEVLRQMALAGAAPALRTILDGRLVPPPQVVDEALHGVACDLLACPNPEGGVEVARTVARDWLTAYGGGEFGLSLALRNLDDGRIAKQLLALGADPNAIAPGQHYTAIGDAHQRQHLDVLEAELAHCAKQNVLAMYGKTESIFPSLLVRDEEYFEINLTARLHQIPQWPESWRLELGAALFGCVENGKRFDLTDNLEAAHCCRLVANSALTAKDWARVLSKIPLGTHLTRTVDRGHEYRRAALQNVLHAGVDVNLPIAALRDGTQCSMFLAAVEAGNAEAVVRLLTLGADPTGAVVREGAEVGAKDLAEGHQDVLAVLASLTARQAMQAATVPRGSMVP
jgi:hypothetical protein